ncbi:e3 ubiquitin ligase HACE1 [Fusarium beomiforme]|uniref:E3 ubiquitin ligase HACE1 n=1 Tax=Fusarium beomiforme TaxID=44412 RepID=A0A9P5E1T1_9HYPO|nr:e3 ubiquitin ligase HACE1 [Fusarium beomiforme]
MNDVQRVLGVGHASCKADSTPERLDDSEVENEDWLTSAEDFAKHIALQEFIPSDSATLTPTDADWDMMHDTAETTNISTVSLMEQEFRLQATIQQVDHLEASNIPVIASNVQLEVIRLSHELNKAKGVTITFQERFRLQERYVNLLLKSTENHDVFGIRAQDYLRDHIIPMINREDAEQRNIWLSVGRMYFTLKVWGPATEWLRLALLHGYVRHARDSHSEIEEISKLVCQIYEKEGQSRYAFALRQVLEHRLGYDPTSIAGDLKRAVEWCCTKGFVAQAERDQLVLSCQRNTKGNTVLHEAALDTTVEKAILPKLMMDDILALKNASGDTALMLAIDKSNTAVISSLLTIPSLLHVRDREGHTPLHRCHDHKILGLVLETLDGSRHRASLTHVDPGSHDASSLIDINSQDACGRTALFMTCEQGNLRMMKKLLEAGADHLTHKAERDDLALTGP